VKSALQIYKELFGNLLVPHAFLVTTNDSLWPEELWGMRLGLTVGSIRSSNAYVDHRDELEAMGFDFKPQRNSYGWLLVERAFKKYREIYGDLQVPLSFIVPKSDAAWPDELRGMKLGRVVSNIRHRGDYAAYRQELEAMGFD
jgi:hypothetical protein